MPSRMRLDRGSASRRTSNTTTAAMATSAAMARNMGEVKFMDRTGVVPSWVTQAARLYHRYEWHDTAGGVVEGATKKSFGVGGMGRIGHKELCSRGL